MSDKIIKHLCDECRLEFATCFAADIVFGADRDPSLKGAAADAVVECPRHEPLEGPYTPLAVPVPVLTFDEFRAANVARCVAHQGSLDVWSSSDWIAAMTEELGEVAGLIKRRNRERDGIPGNKFSPTDKQIADELADLFTYMDLFAASLGIDLGRAAVSKFNEVSERLGLPNHIKER